MTNAVPLKEKEFRDRQKALFYDQRNSGEKDTEVKLRENEAKLLFEKLLSEHTSSLRYFRS